MRAAREGTPRLQGARRHSDEHHSGAVRVNATTKAGNADRERP